MPKSFYVSDGKLILTLEPAGGGWYCVTSPFEQGLVTQARTTEQAFEMAYDARKALREARADLARRFGTDPTLMSQRTAQTGSADAPRRKAKKPARARAAASSSPGRKVERVAADGTKDS